MSFLVGYACAPSSYSVVVRDHLPFFNVADIVNRYSGYTFIYGSDSLGLEVYIG
jgi:hypothetical protein